MACACKRTMEFEDKYGTKVSEGILNTVMRKTLALLMVFLVAGMFIVVTPIVLLFIFYAVLFRKDMRVVPPKFLSKYMFPKSVS